jgi:ubiquinone/menaquinone biosynthesis C-methylase UbiE
VSLNHDLERLRAEYSDREHRFASSDVYSLFNPAQLFLIQHRQRATLHLLRRHGLYPLHDKLLLEIGSGSGGVLLEYLSYSATPKNVYGIDILEYRLADAHARLPNISLACADGQRLPYPNLCFDLILQYTAFSSVLDDQIKVNMAREMVRVLKSPSGIILWYDYWLNPTNPQAKGIRPSEIRRLFPNCEFEFHRITLAPPLTRRLASISWLLCSILEKLKLLNTHYLVAIQPNSDKVDNTATK